MTRIVVGISGASGSTYGVRLLERLATLPVETHLIVSRHAEKTLLQETGHALKHLKALATEWHPIEAIGDKLASGSYLTDGMVIAPCSVNTMSAIATGQASNLLVRAADVTLKERRCLILMVRESPLHLGHLRTMVNLAEMGAILAPPMPALYTRPAGVQEIVDQSVGRVLDLLALPSEHTKRWEGV